MKSEQNNVEELLINIEKEYQDKKRLVKENKKKDVTHYCIWIVTKLMKMLQQTQH